MTAGYVHLDAALVTAADRVSSVLAAALDGEPTCLRWSDDGAARSRPGLKVRSAPIIGANRGLWLEFADSIVRWFAGLCGLS